MIDSGWNALNELNPASSVSEGPGFPALVPNSAAVVIGIGGSGIQTIVRVREALLAGRPEQSAADSVQFVGIDSVDKEDQEPPLPDYLGLSPGSFINIARQGFNARTFVAGQTGRDKFLTEWWDPEYNVPMGPIVEGLKKQRMLGRLAFHRAHQSVVPLIDQAVTRALEIEGDVGEGVKPAKPGVIPVYIINSSVGGTGSSGFLPVVFATWVAAMSRGYTPEIRAFTFLPSVFRTVVSAGQNPIGTARDHDANAYAYFREVDHFLIHSGELGRKCLGQPGAIAGGDIPDGELLKQVYLVGSRMQGIGELTRIQDSYQIVAESIFQFLVSDIAHALVGPSATNTESVLRRTDQTGNNGKGKPRRYCSLGLARVVFPGDTYRRYLTRRFFDWWVTYGLLSRPDDLHEVARASEVYPMIVSRVTQTVESVSTLTRDDEVTDFLLMASGALSALERTGDVATGSKLIGDVEAQAPYVARSLERSVERRMKALLSEFEAFVVEHLFTSGTGLPVASEILAAASKDARKVAKDAEAQASSDDLGRANAEATVRANLKLLNEASNRKLHERLIRKIGSVTGGTQTQQDIALDLGRAIQTWAQSIYDAEISRGKAQLARALDRRIDLFEVQLGDATERIRRLAGAARRQWTDDDLIGKDDGAVATTTVVPGDALPEIEDSSLAVAVFDDVKREHSRMISGEELDELIRQWRLEAENDGLFSLGDPRPDRAMDAERSFTRWLVALAEDRSLMTGTGQSRRTRLPESLAAAEREPNDLNFALQGLAELSTSVCWSWDPARLFLSETESDPVVTTSVAVPEALMGESKKLFGTRADPVISQDAERAVAISVQWGVPLHALNDVPGWKAAYEAVQRLRKLNPSDHHPLHIDRRFDDDLDPLVPEYFKRDVASLKVAQAFVFKQLLADPDSGIIGRYVHGRANPARPLLRFSTDGNWVGTQIRVVDDQLVAAQDDVPLGTTWADLVGSVGRNQRFSDSIAEVLAFSLQVAGPARVLAAVEQLLDEDLIRYIESCRPGGEDRTVLDTMFDAVSEWQMSLQKMADHD